MVIEVSLFLVARQRLPAGPDGFRGRKV